MFSSPSANKENVLGEAFCTTPNRMPLKIVQNGSTTGEGTPLAMTKRTPKARSTRTSTPMSSRKLARRLKRQSVPLALSKPISIFEDSCTKSIFGKNMGVEEGLLLKRNGQELNVMIRDKVSETVIKINEKYESTLAEKQRDLDEKNTMIKKLQSEVNVLKQSHNYIHDEQDKNISMFVEQVISKAIDEIENKNSSSEKGEQNDVFSSGKMNGVKFQSATQTGELKDSWTTMTPTKLISSQTSPMKVELIENETSMTPVMTAHSTTSVTPVKTVDAMLGTSPVCLKNAGMTTSPFRGTDATTDTIPVWLTDTESEIVEHALCQNSVKFSPETKVIETSLEKTSASQTPIKSDHEAEQNFIKNEEFLTPIQEEPGSQRDRLDTIERNKINSTIIDCSVHKGTAMTPIELVDKQTLVSPMQTLNVSVTTSPLVAALQPEIISSLPLNRLRAELESAAISNELLRSECDELNAKVEVLQSSLTEVKSDADKKCFAMQQEMETLQTRLDEALERNYEMEMKKPLNVEEYDETIKKLQKELLLKEKQSTFYIKKAFEADNLQQDLRRMYAKYNTEHQMFTSMEEETKGIKEKFNAKCVEYEALEIELSRVKEALKKALKTIHGQEKVRVEAKESQVKCCVLQEQIENFQSQQRENLEFLEQERKGLEETTVELEQQIKSRTEELEVTRLALEEKTIHYEESRATVQTLQSQLSDLQDELDAVQSQAYLLMLEQEKELTAGSRILEETWEQLATLVQAYKNHVKVQEEPTQKQDCEETSEDEYKPSFVYTVLAAVSGTVPQSEDVRESPKKKETTGTANDTEETANENQACNTENQDLSEEFTLVSGAKAFQKLFSELERYVQDGHEHAQMIMQRQVDEIANLEKSLHEAKQQHEDQMTKLKQELEIKGCMIKEVQRENDNKEYEIERIKLELKTLEENFEASRQNMKELDERCCSLIEQETKNQVLNEKLRLINHELEKVKQDKTCLEKELSESVERLQSLVEASEQNDEEKQKTVIKKSFTEILEKKIHLEREVEKLRSSFAKVLRESETFAQYNARLENKASILGSNLLRAEEEIYRLDGIVDRFCTATQNNWRTITPSEDLRNLLKELHIVME